MWFAWRQIQNLMANERILKTYQLNCLHWKGFILSKYILKIKHNQFILLNVQFVTVLVQLKLSDYTKTAKSVKKIKRWASCTWNVKGKCLWFWLWLFAIHLSCFFSLKKTTTLDWAICHREKPYLICNAEDWICLDVSVSLLSFRKQYASWFELCSGNRAWEHKKNPLLLIHKTYAF